MSALADWWTHHVAPLVCRVLGHRPSVEQTCYTHSGWPTRGTQTQARVIERRCPRCWHLENRVRVVTGRSEWGDL